MKDQINDMSWDDWDELQSPREDAPEFDAVVEAAVSRRGFLSGLVAFGSGAAVMGTGTLLSTTADAAGHSSRFAFTPIDIQTDHTIHVPDGYSWQPVVRWGEPLVSGIEDLNHETAVPVGDSDKVFGENTDGMELFNVAGREVIVVNHEYVNPKINLPLNIREVPANTETGEEASTVVGEPTSADDVLTFQNMQGVTVMEVARGENGWHIVKDSDLTRRITNNTPMTIAGPAAGHDLLKTDADPSGTEVLGTLNNCGSGRTPWGTYLACEENFNGYFGSTDEGFALPADYKRYGISAKGRYKYEEFDPRFDVSKNPNEPHRFGYIVEIDPANPDATPIKHTGLGRFKHENAATALSEDGRVVVYMGDDERGEFMYKFVSNGTYAPGKSTEGLLDDGALFAAKFSPDGTGEWVELTPEATGMDEAEIRIFTRMAASAVGATTMDRPEWVAVNPVSVEGYCCLTNNSRRGVLNDDGTVRTNAGGDPMTPNAVNARAENRYGQIVRWFPSNDDHATSTFRWDLYVMAGNGDPTTGAYAGSPNINAGNLFNSPDGMMFDSAGIVWIQTDGNDSNEGPYAGMGNNQMLAGDPVTGEIVRFMTGPQGAEVTGLTWSSDRRTMFVGIQHPDAPFPDGEGKLARSTVVAVTRDDGGRVG